MKINGLISIFIVFFIILSTASVNAGIDKGKENYPDISVDAVNDNGKEKYSDISVDAVNDKGKEKYSDIFEYKALNQPVEKFVKDEIIVKFKDDVGKNRVDEINRKLGTTIKQNGERLKLMSIPKGKTVQEMINDYSAEPDIEYAEPNYIANILMTPNDPYYKYQWHLNNPIGTGINAPRAWDISNGRGVVVAVIDTGVAYETYPAWWPKYYKAPDLANTCFVPGYNFVSRTTHPNDDNSHGTHVAGTIAQSTNNYLGVAGVAYGACIMPVKVMDKYGSGTYYNIAQGINYAADHGAKVISMSLGGPSPSPVLEEALKHAFVVHRVTIVAAAGNGGVGAPPSYPAAYNSYVIAVAATRYDGTRAYYSTTGDYVDIAAPGGDTSVDQNRDGYADGVLQQTFNPNTKNTRDFGYWFFQGTSMATPHVSGVAALLIAKGVTNPTDVRNILQRTATDAGTTGWDKYYGWGRVNAYKALTS